MDRALQAAHQTIMDASGNALLLEDYGPTPCVDVGQELRCEVNGLQVVLGFHGPRSWPRAKVKGKPQLIVCCGLSKAIRRERRASVALAWGVHLRTVANWRKKLGLNGQTSVATQQIRSARMRVDRKQRPECFELPGLGYLRSLTDSSRRAIGQKAAGERMWKEEELRMLESDSLANLALAFGRTVHSINSARTRSRIKVAQQQAQTAEQIKIASR